MKSWVIFVVLLFISIPFSSAKEVSVPELFEIESGYMPESEKEVYFYVGDKLVSVNGAYQYQDRLNSDIDTKTLPFGKEISNDERFSFTGKELDGDLYYFSARYYDPELGRFTSVDPVPTEPSYSYVRNNPLTFVDPSGTQTATTAPPLVDPWKQELYHLMKEVSQRPAPRIGPAIGAGTGAVLAGVFLTSGPFQAQLQGNHPFHDPFGTLRHLNPTNYMVPEKAPEQPTPYIPLTDVDAETRLKDAPAPDPTLYEEARKPVHAKWTKALNSDRPNQWWLLEVNVIFKGAPVAYAGKVKGRTGVRLSEANSMINSRGVMTNGVRVRENMFAEQLKFQGFNTKDIRAIRESVSAMFLQAQSEGGWEQQSRSGSAVTSQGLINFQVRSLVPPGPLASKHRNLAQ